MVAPQILVLLVGVRILLGELKLNRFGSVFLYTRDNNSRSSYGPFVYRFRTRDSQSLKKGPTPLGTVIRKASPKEAFFILKHNFFRTRSDRGVSARQVPRKGATDGAVSERSRGGGSVQEVRDWNSPTPLGTVMKKLP